jgi:hypothetical protein
MKKSDNLTAASQLKDILKSFPCTVRSLDLSRGALRYTLGLVGEYFTQLRELRIDDSEEIYQKGLTTLLSNRRETLTKLSMLNTKLLFSFDQKEKSPAKLRELGTLMAGIEELGMSLPDTTGDQKFAEVFNGLMSYQPKVRNLKLRMTDASVDLVRYYIYVNNFQVSFSYYFAEPDSTYLIGRFVPRWGLGSRNSTLPSAPSYQAIQFAQSWMHVAPSKRSSWTKPNSWTTRRLNKSSTNCATCSSLACTIAIFSAMVWKYC